MSSHKHYAILDHGYLKLITSWGSDEQIIEAARMSTNKGFLGWEPTTVIECINPSCVGYSYEGEGTAEEVITILDLVHLVPEAKSCRAMDE